MIEVRALDWSRDLRWLTPSQFRVRVEIDRLFRRADETNAELDRRLLVGVRDEDEGDES